MAQHWSDQHGSREVAARTTWLQTFFRGNKIRYFEVSEPASAPTPVTDDDDDQSEEPLVRQASVQQDRLSSTGPGSVVTLDDSSTVTKTGYSKGLSSTQLNNLDLELMHHWSTSTSHTLNRGHEPPSFWSQTITSCALAGSEFLMYGILSASAFHLASQHKILPLSLKYHEYLEIALEYQGYALTGFRKTLAAGSAVEACLAFNRLLCVTRCAEHHLDPDSTDSAIRPGLEGKSLPILECIMLVRGGTDMWYKAQGQLPGDSGLKLPPEVLAGLADIPYDEDVENIFVASASKYPHIPPPLFTILLSIPPRLASTLRDTAPADLASIKYAFASLIVCFNRSYASSFIWAKHNAVEAWPRMVTEHFLNLVEACRPAAVVLLGLWSLLVKRLEAHCWYLQGESRRLWRFVREPLEGELCGLVDEITECVV
jgi:hypothetical protein